MDTQVFRQLLNRSDDSHKYDYGHVLVIGGSAGMVGAPFLASMAAMRVGAGLVTVASSFEVIDKLEKRVVELMTLVLPKPEDKLGEILKGFIKDRKVSLVLIGPGTQKEKAEAILPILLKLDIILVIDGGALSAAAENIKLLDDRLTKTVIMTPHMGEFKRFFKLDLEDNELRTHAQSFADRHNIILALKGHPTWVYKPSKPSYENTNGGPALATAGSGDVLAGIIGGIAAQNIEPDQAVQAAVYLHGLCGDMLTEKKTTLGVIASDIIDIIPDALKDIQTTNHLS